MQLSTMRHCIEFILLIYFLSVKDASAGVLIPIDESHHGHHTGHDHHHAFAPHVGYEREKRHVEHGDHHLASRDGTHEHHADEHHNHHQRKHVHKRSVHYVPVDVINPPRPTSTEYSYIRIKPNNNYGPVDIINPPRPTPRVIEPTYVKPHPNYESIDVINPSSPTPRVVGSTYVKPRSALHKRSVRCISCTARVKSANKYNENVPLEFRKNQETE